MLELNNIHNPAIDRREAEALRDPAIFYHDGTLYCYYTVVIPFGDAYRLHVGLSRTNDLRTWTNEVAIPRQPLNFSSPGNVFRHGDEFIMCMQSYPIDPGKKWGNETSRLWIARSRDLVTWSAPEMLHAEGCRGTWTDSSRQIDPYIVEHDGKWWCFYKGGQGQLGLLVSDKLSGPWREALPDRPAVSSNDMPDHAPIENPCVIHTGKEFAMIIAPCKRKRGIGLAYSSDLINWRDIHYVDFPDIAWADDGPSAAMVLDMRRELGVWLMAFHGELIKKENSHAAALGFAWSTDLEHWEVP